MAKKAEKLPSIDFLKAIFFLDKDTGDLFWKVKLARSIKVGKLAGCIKPTGYKSVNILGTTYWQHRVVYSMYYDVELNSNEQIDHVNQNKSDNSPKNLRVATPSQNQHNKKIQKNNTSGHKGICYDKKRNKWRCYVNVDGKKHSLGRFEFKEDAIIAISSAHKLLHKDFNGAAH